jgi:uncharacterized protein
MGAGLDATVRRRLFGHLRAGFALDWRGVHGAPHWSRVRVNGLAIARAIGAREDVVELFALLHDSQRQNDGTDALHGARAAQWATASRGVLFRLDAVGLELLVYACRHHSDGLIEAAPTVQACWDADRLDLARVGRTPDPRRLCTDAARDPGLLESAIARSVARR